MEAGAFGRHAPIPEIKTRENAARESRGFTVPDAKSRPKAPAPIEIMRAPALL
jgi:hypothetical protein